MSIDELVKYIHQVVEQVREEARDNLLKELGLTHAAFYEDEKGHKKKVSEWIKEARLEERKSIIEMMENKKGRWQGHTAETANDYWINVLKSKLERDE